MNARRVTVLSPELANQIAAGEVVERPASAVKELMENSLDAGARRIEVTIESGGRDYLRVVDDGCGMEREDALRSIERHATSKIRHVEDLFSIATLGFRGEALPSIGSVSRMELCTKPHGSLAGTRLFIEGGVLREIEDVGMAPGTSITVQDLFFNTPARLKFMKATSTESRQVTELVARMSLARPDVRFILKSDGKTRMDLAQASELKERILGVLGREVYDDLYATAPCTPINGVVARGYLSRPGHNQRTAGNIYTFVNGRYVSDRTIRAAVMGAYGQLLENGRFPAVVLFIDVPFAMVDVNVHPAKTEVRFHDTQPVYRAVYHAIADALAQAPWLTPASRAYSLKSDARAGDGPHGLATPASAMLGHRGLTPAVANFEPRDAQHRFGGALRPGWHDPAQKGEIPSPFAAPGAGEARQEGFRLPSAAPLPSPPRFLTESEASPGGDEGGVYFSKLRVIGQFRRAYIVCEDISGLVVIDQHAAHERIGFERLKSVYRTEHKELQPLLFPVRLELDALRSACLEEHLEFFARAGFEIDPFGGTTFVVKSVPAVLARAGAADLIRDALDDLSHLGRSARLEEAMEAILSRMACHSVVRGPTPLTREECEALLVQMDAMDFRGNCPHGRPVYFRMPLMELEKAFERR